MHEKQLIAIILLALSFLQKISLKFSWLFTHVKRFPWKNADLTFCLSADSLLGEWKSDPTLMNSLSSSSWCYVTEMSWIFFGLRISFCFNLENTLNRTRIAKGDFTERPIFLGERGSCCTHSGHQACRWPLRDIASHMRVKHLLIWTLYPFGRLS